MRLPSKKQAPALTNDSRGRLVRYAIGRRGSVQKVGSGPVNWNTERRKRYAAMGPQKMGTTYHAVRVNTSRISELNKRADSDKCLG